MVFYKTAAAIALCLSKSVVAEYVAVEVDEAADMKVQLLQKQKGTVTAHVQRAENTEDEEQDVGDKLHISESTFQLLLESSAKDGDDDDAAVPTTATGRNTEVEQRRAALLEELEGIDAELQESGASDVAAGNCENDHDLNIWKHKGGSVTMPTDMNVCSQQCWGGEFCVTRCMQKRRGYSKPCAQCFGKISACTAGKCMAECMAGGPQCDPCVQAKCRPDWINCMGQRYAR